jgi:excisionase family DNA binding protein
VEKEDLLSAEESWAYLGVSRATFWNLVKRHELQRYMIPVSGKRVYFKREDLDELRKPVPRQGEIGAAA